MCVDVRVQVRAGVVRPTISPCRQALRLRPAYEALLRRYRVTDDLHRCRITDARPDRPPACESFIALSEYSSSSSSRPMITEGGRVVPAGLRPRALDDGAAFFQRAADHRRLGEHRLPEREIGSASRPSSMYSVVDYALISLNRARGRPPPLPQIRDIILISSSRPGRARLISFRSRDSSGRRAC